ncbi:MAG TPA: iron ABC transporter permease [Terriglobia bacterium]|nr:iron ABC transporter permease [Terriglobia bacterium]
MKYLPTFNLLFYVVALGLLLWLVLYPNLHILSQSFEKDGQVGLVNYLEFFHNPSQLEALINSLILSLGSVGFSAVIGVPLAFIFHRYEFPGRTIFAALATLPVLLPPLVGVISFMFLYGESGIITRFIQILLRLSSAPFSLRGIWAILFIHAYTMYAYFYLFVTAGLKRMDFSLQEAARSLGASRLRVFFAVTLPMLTPSLMGASLLTFMTSMASFSAPYLFGGGTRVLALQIYNSKLNGDLAMAYVETVILSLSSILFLILLQRYEGTARYRSLSKGDLRPAREARRRTIRFLMSTLGAGLVLFLLLPHLVLILISFSKDGTWTTEILPPQYTLSNYAQLFSDPHFLEPIRNSLEMSGMATALNFLFAMVVGYLLANRQIPGRTLLNALVLLPWALPGTVLALSLASTFNQAQPLRGKLLLVGTFWLLPLAYFIRNIPLVVRPVQASFEQLDPALAEAGQSLGGSWLYVFRRVTLPMVLPGALAGSMLAFVTALGEFVSSIVIYTINNRPISIEILAQLRQFNFGSAAAYGVLLILLMAAVFFVSHNYFSQADRSSVPY